MQVYKRGKYWWASWTEHGVTIRRTTRCQDKEAAKLVARRWERELADPDHAAENKASVTDATSKFLALIDRPGANRGTLNMYKCKIGHVNRLLGAYTLKELTHDLVVRKFIRIREEEGAHQHTIHRELTALRRSLKVAAQSRLFNRDVRSVVPSISADYTPRTRWLTEEELDALIAHLDPSRAAVVAFIVATSARRGEAFRARREDVGKDSIDIRGTKTATAKRQVPVLSIFKEYVKFASQHGDGVGTLFKPWVSMRRDILKACERAGIVACTANDLRRTTATWLAKSGIPLSVVARVLGHKSVAMVMKVYGQLDAQDLGRIIEDKLNENARRA